MAAPKVTFLVPCYKLAHLLGECVQSILTQTYGDFEILILDDCSPDNTPEVARSFNDPRVKHIRNEPNLGHLRNYNKGIGLAAGEYIWLISADDKLRKPYVLEQYVNVMDSHPDTGFTFCRGMSLLGDRETGIVQWASLEGPDAVLAGRTFLRRLLESNCVLAPSGMVRKACYGKLGAFPLDLPFAGDWYLWCLFSLHYDVAYFSEPMVNYREHPQSMTDILAGENVRLLSRDDLAVRWRMKDWIDKAGDRALAEHCMNFIVEYYARSLASKNWRGARYRMTLAEFDASLNEYVADAGARAQIRTRVLSGLGSQLYLDPAFQPDPELFRLALAHDPGNFKLRLKYLMLRSGALGRMAMQAASAVRGSKRRLPAEGS